MSDFKKLNNISGWVVFLISFIVYALTVERTASFWDCGEFIAIAYKLEVSHPPGAPLFMLIGRLFSFLSFGDSTRVAYWINMSSALASAFTILFLFWTIVMLGRKVFAKGAEGISTLQNQLLIGAGAVGALSFTFTDSFWFSAVEGEVYALSSFFTAFVFWAMLKWELIEEESRANKWLILIAYMMGLSIGIHLLGLVTLPALGLIYYFKKYKKVTALGVIIALAVSGFFVILINSLIIPGLPTLAGKFEITFVNTLGLPFGSGAIFLTVLIIALLVFSIRYTIKKDMVNLNTALTALTFILIGYSCYAVILIRSRADTPIDQNNPEDVMTFVSYLKREQYGDRPLLYGRHFTAPPPRGEKGSPIYYKGEDQYEIADYKYEYTYDEAHQTFFPRMYSSSPAHVARYRQITGLREGQKPTFGDNLAYLFKHQLGHMYMRYFMFNFSGRESDIQDAEWLGPLDGNENVPRAIAENKARNQYFMIPLILGLIGFFFQFNKDQKGFFATLLFFFLTGIALVLYLNFPPVEPRERDYIFVGSFYVFAIWIGFSVLALGQLLMKRGAIAVYGAIAVCFLSPVILAKENWDDHNRSNRYFSVDSARNFLAACAPNAILFTGGDNDTFPLWYVQEVEGFRTDVRGIVLSYYNTDWYVDQTTYKMNDSDAFPYSLTIDNYRQGANDFLLLQEFPQFKDRPISLRQYMDLLKKKNPALKQQLASGDEANVVPAKQLLLEVDTAAVLQSGIIPDKLRPNVTDRMVFTFKNGKRILEKGQMMMLDLIAQNNWERPIYFNFTSVNALSFDVSNHLVQEGLVYRLLPVRRPGNVPGMVNTDLMYDNVMNKFAWRELDNPKANLNGDYRGFIQNHRSTLITLADALTSEGDTVRAKKVLDFGLQVMPRAATPYDNSSVGFVQGYFNTGEDEKAVELAMEMGREFDELLTYHQDMGRYDYYFSSYYRSLNFLREILARNGKSQEAEELKKLLDAQGIRTREYNSRSR